MIRVVVIEDHDSFRAALCVVLELEDGLGVVGEGARGNEVTPLLSADPDVAVVDLDLPGGDGIEVVQAIRAARPGAACVVLTATTDAVQLGRAVEAGAAAVLHKSAGMPEVLATIRLVAEGGSRIDPTDAAAWLQALAARRREQWQARVVAAALSPREREVLDLLATGSATDEIADGLHITPQTVQTHVRNLMAKLGARSRLEAVTEAIRLGIVTPRVDVSGRLPEIR